MGNHPSTSIRNGANTIQFRRPTGILGLSRSELDERCKPSGLYTSCSWDDRIIRRLIGDGKIAARLIGKDERTTGIEHECPICFLQYDEINLLHCCKATICTECYLQIQDPSTAVANANSNQKVKVSICPFCNQENIDLVVAKKLESDDIVKREEEEQKFIEATIRARSNSENTSLSSSPNTFGSRLNEEMMKRARSRTMSDYDSSDGVSNNDAITEQSASIETLATMTPEERRELENQMRSQLSHPLMMEIQRNAEIESQRHLFEHAERNRERMRESREQLESMIDRMRRRFDFGGDDDDEDGQSNGSTRNGTSGVGDGIDRRSIRQNNIDELYFAALYLTAQDSMRRRGNSHRAIRRPRNNDHTLLRALLSGRGERLDERNDNVNRNLGQSESNENDDGNQITAADFLLSAGMSEASQMEMAIQLSLREAQEQEDRERQQNSQDGQQEQGNGENEGSGVDQEAEDASTQND